MSPVTYRRDQCWNLCYSYVMSEIRQVFNLDLSADARLMTREIVLHRIRVHKTVFQ